MYIEIMKTNDAKLRSDSATSWKIVLFLWTVLAS